MDCGVACVQMILEYYKVPYDQKALRKELNVLAWGTSTPSLGMALMKRGFEVEIVSMNPGLFNLDSHFPTQEKMLGYLKKLKKDLLGRINKYVVDQFIQFVEAGGTLTPRIPTAEDIREETSEKRPVLCHLTHWFLQPNNKDTCFTFHFNIITGLDGEKIFVNDPDLEQKRVYNVNDYLYAIYAGASGAIDNACLLKVKKASKK